ncbi:glutamate receptor ionotropic, kainate 2-like isoform X3 [Octopus sinensis]|uniref:Glutamate receptor ionotropic, kainate 2-like isoform X3 n=1 Tax=Octopus sinensis TaxID=2607531 RepID=A0A7E6EXP9_9MOLL|nr:glutamate receptor ionotropic, kainate 2-like isoform X3 [Octopus sinensis]
MKAKKEIPFPLFMLTMLLVIMESTTADEGDAMSNTNYFVKAALVGEKGHVELDFFRDAAEILLRNTTEYEEQENCTIQFIPLEFDLNNASNVLQNLTHAHRLFKQSEVDVAIGPFIDHFTSPNYVIMEPTCHYLTTSSAYVRKSENKDRIRTLLPDLEDFSTAVAKVMEKLGWKQVVFLSDDDFSPILKLRESNILVNPILLPSMHHLGSGHDPLYETLRTLRSSEWPNFVLHSSNLGIVRKVLKKAKDMHLLFGELNWFVTYLNFRALESTISDKSLTNIYGLELVNESMIPKEIISNHSEKSILDIAVTVDLINILLHISGRKCQTKPEPEKFNKMEVPYVGALGYYFLQNDRRTNYVIKIQTPKELVGSINVTDTGVSVEVQTREKKDGISPFGKNETLRIVMGEALPFIKYDSNTKKFSGFCYDILQKLSTILNFKYEIQFVNRDEENQQSYNTNPSVDFLIDQLVSGYEYGILNDSDLKEFFQTSQKDPYERMWLQMQSDELIIDQIENAIDKVRKNNFALINDQIVNEYYAGKNCELESHTQPIEEKSYAFAFPKGAPYRDEINRVLLELKENGTLDKIKNDWLFGKCGDQNIKDRKKEKENSALKFEDMMGLFIVMAASAAIAVLFEILRQIHIYIQTHCKTKPNFYQREVKEKELEINEERFL